MSLPVLAVRRPVTTLMLLVSIMVMGTIAFNRLPIAYLPQIDFPFIQVNVPRPNSNPAQIEREVTKPVEEVLSTLSGVKTLYATSTADNAQFGLEFEWGQKLDMVRMQVSEKMEQIRPSLPEDIGEIMIFSFSSSDIPVVEARLSADGVDLSESYELIEARILNRIRRVPGVARVDLDGVLPKEIAIDLELAAIKAHRVDVSQLIQRLQGATANMVLGQVSQDGLRYSARAIGAFATVDEIENIIINDQGLRISDIAEVVYEEPPIGHGRHLDGSYAVGLSVFKESTANIVEVVNAVMKVIHDDINRDDLLKGINLFVWENQADEITNGIDGLKSAGAIGGLLAIGVLFLFLRRLDSTVIVSFSIPFSIIAATGALYFMGKSLNLLSMMGLMIGVGMLVDNAVVVLEAIDRTHRTEPDTKKAAMVGAKSVWVAVFSSTLTTIIVFLPVIMSNSNLMTWLAEVGVTISIALACSLFSSLTLIPLMSATLLRRREAKPVRWINWLEDKYAGALGWTLKHRIATAFLVIVVLFVGFAPFYSGMVPLALFSATVHERIQLIYDFADFTYKSKVEQAVNVIEGYLDEHKEEFAYTSLYSFYQENFAATTMVLADKSMSDDEVKELRKKIREGLPEIAGARVFFHEDADEGGDSTFFAVKFFGQDSEILQGLATEADRLLGTMDGVQDVFNAQNQGRREIQVSIDRAKAAKHGLTAQDISQVFAFTLRGIRLNRFNTGDREVETWLDLRFEDRQNIDDMKQLTIAGGDRPVRLGDIADFQIVRRANEIKRENRKVRVSVNATYEGDDWDAAKEQITTYMDALDMPAGYSWSWNNRIIRQADENSQMLVNFILALGLVYIVMASLFESFAQPFAILLSIPFSIIGVAWTLMLTGTPFNLMVWIGTVILIGIVVNNGIVLLDHMNQLRKTGLSRHEAIIQAGRDRLRPILMTASTTVVGLLPLAIGGSKVGGLLYFPLARAVMGGLISSALLTLLLLPSLTLAFEGIGTWMLRVWRLSSAVKQQPEQPVQGPAYLDGAPGRP